MARPKLVDHIKLRKDWIPDFKKHPCFLYGFKQLGITKKQFGKIISGYEAILFEKPLEEKLRAVRCPWCEFNQREQEKKRRHLHKKFKQNNLEYHVYKHNKNFVEVQVKKFQQELYTLRLGLVRQGYHGCIPFLVEHECQFCIEPVVKDRKGMCSIPESSRNKMRSLKTLGYPIKEITKHRLIKWSMLGIIVLKKT